MKRAYRELGLHAALFFVYGAAVHFFLFRAGSQRAHLDASAARFLSGLPMVGLVAVLGGLLAAIFFVALLVRRRSPQPPRPLRLLLRGALYGLGATSLTAAAAGTVGAAVLTRYLTLHPAADMAKHLPANAWWMIPLLFLFAELSIGTYAVVNVVSLSPYVLLYGAVAGLYVVALPPQPTVGAAWEGRPSDAGAISLLLGISGAVLFAVPLAGLVLGALAVLYGVRGKAWRRGSRGAVSARAGTVLGIGCVAFWTYSAAVFTAAACGWLPHR